jgi:hypothetical protein
MSDCKCEANNDPLCGFCQDDLYCPQCGSEITTVFSPDAVRDESVDPPVEKIWVYPKENEFLVWLSRSCWDQDRQPQCDVAELDTERSILSYSPWFQSQLVRRDVNPVEKSLGYRLVPRADRIAEWGDQWYALLDLRGVELQLTAVGGFKQKQFTLHVCRKPEVAVRFSGRDILEDDTEVNSWEIGNRAELRVTIEIEATTAPVYIEKPVELIMGNRKIAELRPSQWLKPGDVPYQDSFTLDCTQWEEDDQREIIVKLPFHSCGLLESAHTFTMVPSGYPEFSQPNIDLDYVMYGDWIESGAPLSRVPSLIVRNKGAAQIYLQSPEITVSRGHPFSRIGELRIAVQWKNEGIGQAKLLLREQAAEIALTIDLRDVPEGSLGDEEIRGDLTLREVDRDREWRLPLVIRRIIRRPVCDRRVAIDFGSTNTYVAVRNQNIRAPSDQQVVPVFDDHDPERFPSAIYFQDVSDPQHPKYLIGPEAIREGRAMPQALLSGLKRWVGVGGRHGGGPSPQWSVWDRNGKDAVYDTPTVIRFFLRGLIQRCEDRLREKVHRIGVAFPTDFTQRRVRAYEEILDNLAEELKNEDPPRILEYRAAASLAAGTEATGPLAPAALCALDEATAVMLSFVLDSRILREHILQRLAGRPYLVIGSVDVGGGTVDTALIRVRFHNFRRGIDLVRFSSEYLGFGGDRQFGGDNVTVACFERLLRQLEEILQAAAADGCPAWTIPWARPGDEHGDQESRQNFDALWDVAEHLKFFLCKRATTGNEKRDLLARLNLHLANVWVERPGGAPGEKQPLQLDERAWESVEKFLADVQAALDAIDAPPEDESARVGDEASIVQQGCRSELFCTLADLYDHRIIRDLQDNGGYTARERLERCVNELIDFAEIRTPAAGNEQGDEPDCKVKHKERIDFVVLAGAGARLPLVEELLVDRLARAFVQEGWEFPDAEPPETAGPSEAGLREQIRRRVILKDDKHAKSKVAWGLVRYLTLQENSPSKVRGLRMSTQYSQAAIGRWSDVMNELMVVVPRCSPIDDPKHGYPLHGVTRNDFEIPILRLHYLDHDRLCLLGHFDLSQPPLPVNSRETSDEQAAASSVPQELPDDHCLVIRFHGNIDRVELCVEVGDQCYGSWWMIPHLEVGNANDSDVQQEEG